MLAVPPSPPHDPRQVLAAGTKPQLTAVLETRGKNLQDPVAAHQGRPVSPPCLDL